MRYLRRKALIGALITISTIFFVTSFAFAENIQSAIGIFSGKIVNLRQGSTTSSKILTKIPKGNLAVVMGKKQGWVKVKFENIVGWVSSDYFKLNNVSKNPGKVSGNILNLRKEPNLKSDIIGKLNKGLFITVLDTYKEWHRIQTGIGKIGWVSSDYIAIQKQSPPQISRSDDEREIPEVKVINKEATASIPPEPIQATGQVIVDFAKGFLGVKYIYGGDTPQEGFDCSGLVQYVYANFKITLERTAAKQAAEGVSINRSELLAGDLVFFDTTGNGKNIDHVGIYIGENIFIHAASPRFNVTITSLSDSYYLKYYILAKRILQ